MTKYPNGMSSFEAIRLGNFLYVDKTAYIAKLIEGRKYNFLSRPRRFGKSLFVSTLEAFFLGKRELFQGLDIYSHERSWEAWPVIRIDFTPQSFTDEKDLYYGLNKILSGYESEYDIKINETDLRERSFQFMQERFYNLIEKAHESTGKGVVVLVDEYEKPVVDNLDNETLREKNRTHLSGFYSVLKALDAKLRLVFLTGVTKFGQMSVFSGLNNIHDISLSPEYGAVCGITENELLENLKEGIEGIAEYEETDFEGAVKLLKQNYDGYHFCENCPDIYNPYSIIGAMDDRKIGPYWASSGVPTILAKTLRQKSYNFEKLEGALASAERLTGIDNQAEDPVALFYQTGYLTIKEYLKRFRLYRLGFPNREVEGAFYNYLLPVYSNVNKTSTSNTIDDIAIGLITGNPEKSLSVLQSFTAGITYELLDKIEIEQHFEDLIYIIFKALLPYVSEIKAEERTSDGRMDLLIKTADYIYILELKIDSSAEKAIEQIEKKEYALQYLSDPRKIFLIGVNFSTSKRRIDSWKIKPLASRLSPS